nr:G protein-coupled receptor [Proales similis]
MTEVQLNATIVSENTLEKPLDSPIYSAMTIALLTVFISSLILNSITVFYILKSQILKTFQLLILNLALADIIYSLSIPFFLGQFTSFSWNLGLFGCRTFFLTDLVGTIVSILTVTALSLQRSHELINQHGRLRSFSNRSSTGNINFFLLSSWTLALAFTLPLVLSLQVEQSSPSMQTCHTSWQESHIQLYFVLKLLFVFILPFIIVLMCSIRMILFLTKWKWSRLQQRRTLASLASIDVSRPSNRSTLVPSIVELEPSQALISFTRSNNESSAQSARRTSALLGPSLFSLSSAAINSAKNVNTEASSTFQREADQQQWRFQSFVSTFFLNDTDDGSIANQACAKAVRLVFTIVVFFILQWTPLWSFQLYSMFSSGHIENIQTINILVSTASYTNTVANPVIYILSTSAFQSSLKGFFDFL